MNDSCLFYFLIFTNLLDSNQIHFGSNNETYITCKWLCNVLQVFHTTLYNDPSVNVMKSNVFARWPCCFLPLTKKEPFSKFNVSLSAIDSRGRVVVAEKMCLVYVQTQMLYVIHLPGDIADAKKDET